MGSQRKLARYFLYKLVMVMLMQAAWQDAFTWPLLVFLVSCCVYPLASSCAHTFSTMSTRARHICFFFDYGALSLYSLGSAITYSAYVFPDKWVNGLFHQSYVAVAVVNTLVCTTLACYSRRPNSEVFLCTGEGCTDNGTNVLHYYHIALAFLTAFLFATHLPERLAPGSFDYIGHSHQLFHVCSIVGTHFQMKAIEQDMATRRAWLLTHSSAISFSNTLGAALLSLLLNLTVISFFSLPLLSPSFGPQRSGIKTRSCHGGLRDLKE
ncbi:hypothetical protein CRUP_034417 [Coryphaenoides rupestris]|nr:hypothetical protein CRUP_034417 [Coryphaenoides rupestris]